MLGAWWPSHARGRSATIALPAVDPAISEAGVDLLGLDLPTIRRGRLRGHAWEQLQLPAMSRDSVLLSLCNSGPVACQHQLVVLHDAAVMATPAAYSRAYRTWHRFLLSRLMRGPALIATVSEFSASELTRWFGRRRLGLHVIHESGEHILRQSADSKIFDRIPLAGRRYVLAVGSRSPNKNLGAIVSMARIFRDMDVKVVAAGGENQRVFTGDEVDIDNLIMAGYVTNGELRALYEGAECFAFPSHYEGFGLPPLEAMHSGCPVVVSNRASLPEICGTAALYCDPDDPADLAAQVRRLLESESLRREMREAGYARVMKFTWASAASHFDQVLSHGFAGANI